MPYSNHLHMSRAMLHDDRVYAEPEKFNPDRFMPREGHTSEPDPRNVAFGFGRRYVSHFTGPTLLFIWSLTSRFFFHIARARATTLLRTPSGSLLSLSSMHSSSGLRSTRRASRSRLLSNMTRVVLGTYGVLYLSPRQNYFVDDIF